MHLQNGEKVLDEAERHDADSRNFVVVARHDHVALASHAPDHVANVVEAPTTSVPSHEFCP